MRVTKAFTASLVASLIAVPHATARPAPDAPRTRPPLGGVNRLTGDTAGYAEVRLDRKVPIDARVMARRERGPNPDVTIEGGGSFAGFMLTTAPRPGEDVELVLIGGQFRHCGGGVCDSNAPLTNYMEPSRDFGRGPRTIVLQPGDYRLYLLTDGVKSTVTLRLDALEGALRLRPRVATDADMASVRSNVSLEHGHSVASAGNVYRLGSKGVVLFDLLLWAREFRGIELGACLYSVGTAPPSEVAYGPHCTALMEPGLVGGYRLSAAPVAAGPGERLSVRVTALYDYSEGSLPNVDDRHGAGLWYASAGTIDRASAQFVYVTF